VAGAHVAVVGGPFDGVGRSAGYPFVVAGHRERGSFAWIDAAGRVWRAAAPGRELYRLVLEFGRPMVFVYAGDRWERCPGECGGYTQRVEGGRESQPCRLCAAASSRRSI
jgi:hypothetical protein